MEDKIKELTLLLMYLPSWKDNELGNPTNRTWKGYAFNTSGGYYATRLPILKYLGRR